ncbi:hypothetical protein [Halalkalicoccus jeotgali]|uniref:Uncharacterized protein n=1 Tax=Halalkalicoccus jeotgali (strain DSM 18796 / CECT 7217 / JCM 14584 / KCTC 4019 / B3) TaxID=795797 RepID=D8J4M3_HALJB|nr:hypothetical protein [Halalkalicoccus jeotgali]ADJ15490.1 hypothetical protein HacjB3_10535 [Halalkalicoccus jeotgali B3]ELY36101.1 hypothetical protein C497_12132 [Halalkalicoccus jeotgali B3]
MTDDTDTNAQWMKDIDHTHPYDDTSAGALFARGPVVVADGGRRDAEGKDRMKDVDHTPPHDDEGAKRVFERGEEYDGDVVEEE